jgi:hypothetical protein
MGFFSVVPLAGSRRIPPEKLLGFMIFPYPLYDEKFSSKNWV